MHDLFLSQRFAVEELAARFDIERRVAFGFGVLRSDPYLEGVDLTSPDLAEFWTASAAASASNRFSLDRTLVMVDLTAGRGVRLEAVVARNLPIIRGSMLLPFAFMNDLHYARAEGSTAVRHRVAADAIVHCEIYAAPGPPLWIRPVSGLWVAGSLRAAELRMARGHESLLPVPLDVLHLRTDRLGVASASLEDVLATLEESATHSCYTACTGGFHAAMAERDLRWPVMAHKTLYDMTRAHERYLLKWGEGRVPVRDLSPRADTLSTSILDLTPLMLGVASLQAAEDAEVARAEQEAFQKLIGLAAAVFVGPALAVSLYGADVGLPEKNTTRGTLILAALSSALLVLGIWAVRALDGTDPATSWTSRGWQRRLMITGVAMLGLVLAVILSSRTY